jgi:DNA polymerase-3 subunit delta'
MDNFSELLMHPQTFKQFKGFIAQPSHAVLISGPAGSGKKMLARALAASVLNKTASELYALPYVYFLRATDGKEISIDAIRVLKKNLSLIPPGENVVRQVAIIENGDLMSPEAQNSVLKILEEPPESTMIVMTLAYAGKIKATVLSRMQEIKILPVARQQARQYFKSENTAKADSAWQLSQGKAALMVALLSQTEHPLRSSINEAKKFIRMNRYDRLRLIDSYQHDKQKLKEFLNAILKILTSLSYSNIKNINASTKILNSRKLLLSLGSALDSNASTRLVALKLVVKLKL